MPKLLFNTVILLMAVIITLPAFPQLPADSAAKKNIG